jgi:hypothetical protein
MTESNLSLGTQTFTSSTRTRWGGSCLKDIRTFSSIELACAVRQPSPCVRALCESGVLFHMSHLKLHFTLHSWQSSHFTVHTSHCTLHTAPFAVNTSLHTVLLRLHTSHFTLHTPHFALHSSGRSLLNSEKVLHTDKILQFSLLSSRPTLHTSHCWHHIGTSCIT